MSVSGEQHSQLPGPETVQVLMDLVLTHYIKHHEAVLLKLGHARAATLESLQGVAGNAESGDLPREIKQYDKLWQSIIGTLEHHGVSESELDEIEDILLSIPRLIRKCYEAMVRQDEVLQGLIKELEDEKYKNALELVSSIQKMPDMMSGLDPSVYDLPENAVGADIRFFRPPSRDKKKSKKR